MGEPSYWVSRVSYQGDEYDITYHRNPTTFKLEIDSVQRLVHEDVSDLDPANHDVRLVFAKLMGGSE